jgi:hypothetical protein
MRTYSIVKAKNQKRHLFFSRCFFCLTLFGFSVSNGLVEGQEPTPTLQTLLTTEAKEIEALRHHLEEWGTVTVSQPVQVYDTSAFNLGSDTDFDPTKTYIKGATGAQGGVSENLATYLGSGTDASLSADTGAVKATSTNTGSDNTQQTLSVVTPTPFPSPLPAASSSAISQRQALLLGINDKLTELIMRQMANPGESNASRYRTNFAIVQISVNPGWRTQENYIADCSATCYYNYDNFRIPRDRSAPQIEAADGKSVSLAPSVTDDNIRYAAAPKVFSVLPLLDAQTLDLQNSESQVTNLILRVAAQYPGSLGQVNFKQLFQAIRSYARSATSSTALTVTNSYSSGSTFGFRIAPSFTAILNPAARRSGSANRMISTSFPVLVTLIHLKADLDSYHWVEARLNSRWLLYQRPTFSHWLSRIGLPMHREKELDRFNWTNACAQAEAALGKIDSLYPGDASLSTQALRTDLWSLEAKGIGRVTRVALKPQSSNSGTPTISSIGPKGKRVSLSLTDPTVIVVTGENLVRPGVAVAGPYATTNILSVPPPASQPSGQACVVIFGPAVPPDANPSPTPGPLTLYCTAGSAISSDPITFPVKKQKSASSPPTIASIVPSPLKLPADSISINGKGFGEAIGSVLLDKKELSGTVQSWHDSEIDYSLPTAVLLPGEHSLSISINGQESKPASLLISRMPSLANLYISKDGKSLTLNGSGFGPKNEKADFLKINEFNVSKFTSWTDAKIEFDNPSTDTIKSGVSEQIEMFLDADAAPNPTAKAALVVDTQK